MRAIVRMRRRMALSCPHHSFGDAIEIARRGAGIVTAGDHHRCSPRTTSSCAVGSSTCWPTNRTSTWWPSARRYDELLAAVDEHQPDVLLTDIRMPPDHADEGIRAAQELRERWPDIGVVVLSQYDDPEHALRLFDGGVKRRGYLLKDHVADPPTWSTAIREVAAGGSSIDPAVVDVDAVGPRRPCRFTARPADRTRARGAGGDGERAQQHGDRRPPRDHGAGRGDATSIRSSPSSTWSRKPTTTAVSPPSSCSSVAAEAAPPVDRGRAYTDLVTAAAGCSSAERAERRRVLRLGVWCIEARTRGSNCEVSVRRAVERPRGVGLDHGDRRASA